jgi:hypothetical protein
MTAMTPDHLSEIATAAGFAMATEDDLPVERVERNEAAAWRVVESKLRPIEPQPSAVSTATGWLRGAIGSFSRGAPA